MKSGMAGYGESFGQSRELSSVEATKMWYSYTFFETTRIKHA